MEITAVNSATPQQNPTSVVNEATPFSFSSFLPWNWPSHSTQTTVPLTVRSPDTEQQSIEAKIDSTAQRTFQGESEKSQSPSQTNSPMISPTTSQNKLLAPTEKETQNLSAHKSTEPNLPKPSPKTNLPITPSVSEDTSISREEKSLSDSSVTKQITEVNALHDQKSDLSGSFTVTQNSSSLLEEKTTTELPNKPVAVSIPSEPSSQPDSLIQLTTSEHLSTSAKKEPSSISQPISKNELSKLQSLSDRNSVDIRQNQEAISSQQSSVATPKVVFPELTVNPKSLQNFHWKGFIARLNINHTPSNTSIQTLTQLFHGLVNVFFNPSDYPGFNTSTISKLQDLGMRGQDVHTLEIALSADPEEKEGSIALLNRNSKELVIRYHFTFNPKTEKYYIETQWNKASSAPYLESVSKALFGEILYQAWTKEATSLDSSTNIVSSKLSNTIS